MAWKPPKFPRRRKGKRKGSKSLWTGGGKKRGKGAGKGRGKKSLRGRNAGANSGFTRSRFDPRSGREITEFVRHAFKR